MASSKVVRFVNLRDGITENLLEMYIQERVCLSAKIKKIYIGMWRFPKLVYAFVIFYCNSDAVNTVTKLNGTKYNNVVLDVALIGPNEEYVSYNLKWYLNPNSFLPCEGHHKSHQLNRDQQREVQKQPFDTIRTSIKRKLSPTVGEIELLRNPTHFNKKLRCSDEIIEIF